MANRFAHRIFHTQSGQDYYETQSQQPQEETKQMSKKLILLETYYKAKHKCRHLPFVPLFLGLYRHVSQ